MNDSEFVTRITKHHMSRMLSDPEVRSLINRYGIEQIGDELGYMLKLDVFREFVAREHMSMPDNISDKVAEQYMDYMEEIDYDLFSSIIKNMKSVI